MAHRIVWSYTLRWRKGEQLPHEIEKLTIDIVSACNHAFDFLGRLDVASAPLARLVVRPSDTQARRCLFKELGLSLGA